MPVARRLLRHFHRCAELGAVQRRDIDGVTGAFPPQLEWDLGFPVGGLISHQVFRPGALTLDFAARELIVSAGGAGERG